MQLQPNNCLAKQRKVWLPSTAIEKSRSPFTFLLDKQLTYQVFVFAPHVRLVFLIGQFKIMTGKRGERQRRQQGAYCQVGIKAYRLKDFDTDTDPDTLTLITVPEQHML